MGFIFGAPGLPKTQAELDNLRKITQAMAMRPQKAPSNIGEGLNAIGQALVYRGMMDDVNKAGADLQKQQGSIWSNIGGMLSGAPAAATPATPAAPTAPVTPQANTTSDAALSPAPLSQAPQPLSGGGLPQNTAALTGAVAKLESGNSPVDGPAGGYANYRFQQFPAFAKQYGTGADGVVNYAKQVLAANPNATFGDMYGGYVTGTGNPATAAVGSLKTTTQPGAQGAYGNLVRNSPVDPKTPLWRLLASGLGDLLGPTSAYADTPKPGDTLMQQPIAPVPAPMGTIPLAGDIPLPAARPVAAPAGFDQRFASVQPPGATFDQRFGQMPPAGPFPSVPMPVQEGMPPADAVPLPPSRPIPPPLPTARPAVPGDQAPPLPTPIQIASTVPPRQQIAQALSGFTPGALPNVTNVPTKPVDLPAGMGAREAITRALTGQGAAPAAATVAAAPAPVAPVDQTKAQTARAMQLLQQYGQVMDPTQKALLTGIVTKGMAPTNLKPETVNGRVYAFDPGSGSMKDVTPAGVGFRPLVSPQERAQFGIDPNDHRPYQAGPDGKLVTPPGAPTVNIDQRAPNEFEKTYGEGMGKRALAVIESGDKAANDYQQAQLLKNLLSGIQTGKLTQAGATMGAWLQAAGIDPKAVGIDPNLPASAEAAGALINKMALSGIGAGNGGIPANNFSEADRNFMVKTVPGLANRPEANDVLLAIKERQAMLAMEQANRWADARANGISYEKFEQQWRKELQSRNIFGDLAQKLQQVPAPGGAAPQPGAAFAPPSNWQFSPSRKQYRDPQGNIYDMNGQPVK